jgi:drug/metabolite transporter (DMT)-like permease
LVELILTGAVMIVLRVRGAVFRVPTGTTLGIPAASSLADAAAIALFAHASEVGSISIAAAVSATFPLVVIAGGLVLFHERPSARQWLGVLAAITGLVLLGLGR